MRDLFIFYSLLISSFLKYIQFSSWWQRAWLKIFLPGLLVVTIGSETQLWLMRCEMSVRILGKAFIFLMQVLLLSSVLTVPLYLESKCNSWSCSSHFVIKKNIQGHRNISSLLRCWINQQSTSKHLPLCILYENKTLLFVSYTHCLKAFLNNILNM